MRTCALNASPGLDTAHTSPTSVSLKTLRATWLRYFTDEEVEVQRGENDLPFGLKPVEERVSWGHHSWRWWSGAGVGAQAGKSLKCLVRRTAYPQSMFAHLLECCVLVLPLLLPRIPFRQKDFREPGFLLYAV